MTTDLIIHQLHKKYDYQGVWHAMKQFTLNRSPDTVDRLWILEHTPVYTQGLAGKPEHLLNPHHIPVVHSDRGGQITYHGPGQLMVYSLLDLGRLKLSARDLVCKLERSVIDYLATFDIKAIGKRDAPGVYVDDAKICSIGLRVKQNRSYHGIALNINMDLSPFQGINPCGYKGLKMCQLADFHKEASIKDAREAIIPTFCANFGYNAPLQTTDEPQELIANGQSNTRTT